MKSWLLLALSLLWVLQVLPGLDLDREELDTVGSADIRFENYTGPQDRIDSAMAIRGIGVVLAQGVLDTGTGRYGDKYTARRYVGLETDSRLAADIIEILPDGQVDHITNLRRILAGYLERAWQYGENDADLIARFVTVYNAVYRGSLDIFSERYRPEPVAAMDARRVGLAVSFRDWPGGTQIVIPIRDDRSPGDLDAVAPGQLIDPNVIAHLRDRVDLGIGDRKAIIELIERVIQERTEAIEAEQMRIVAEQAEIAERQDEIAQEIAAAPVPENEEPAAPATPEETVAVPAETPSEGTVPTVPSPADRTVPADSPSTGAADQPPATVEQAETGQAPTAGEPVEPAQAPTSVPALEAEQASLTERSQELDERTEELAQDQAEVEELTRQVQELYQETAQDQEAIIESPQRVNLIPVVIGGNGFELMLVNADTLEPFGTQTVPISGRDRIAVGDSLYAVHGSSRHLLRIDGSSLDVLSESAVTVAPGAPLLLVQDSILSIVQDRGQYFVGHFDGTAALMNRSSSPVSAGTDLVVIGTELLVQTPGGGFARLDLTELTR